MDIEYFFYVDDSTLQHLRPATSDEQQVVSLISTGAGPLSEEY